MSGTHTTQYLAGSVADRQGSMAKVSTALLDSVPKALPGLFTKSIHADDFSGNDQTVMSKDNYG